jgi:hypothetical protein
MSPVGKRIFLQHCRSGYGRNSKKIHRGSKR